MPHHVCLILCCMKMQKRNASRNSKDARVSQRRTHQPQTPGGRREFVENFTHEEMAAHVRQRQGIGVIRGWRAPEYKWTRSLEGLCNIVYKLDSAQLVVQPVGKISPPSLSLSLSKVFLSTKPSQST